jgi:hypothetical protein
MVAVAICQNFAIEQAIAEALTHLDLEAIIRSKRVAVKPNDTCALSYAMCNGSRPASWSSLAERVRLRLTRCSASRG